MKMRGCFGQKFFLMLTMLYAFLSYDVFSQYHSDKLIPFRIKNKWGLINDTGKIVLEAKYDETFPLLNLRARVKKGNKFGFVDTDGKFVIPLEYDSAWDFGIESARVCKDGRCFSIDRFNLEFKTFSLACYDDNFGKIMMNSVFRENDFCGLLSFHGDTLIKPLYKSLKECEIQLCDFFIAENQDGKFGVINEKGEVLQDFIFDLIKLDRKFKSWYYFVYKEDKIGALNISGDWEALVKYDNLKHHEFYLYTILSNGEKGYIHKGKELWFKNKRMCKKQLVFK